MKGTTKVNLSVESVVLDDVQMSIWFCQDESLERWWHRGRGTDSI